MSTDLRNLLWERLHRRNVFTAEIYSGNVFTADELVAVFTADELVAIFTADELVAELMKAYPTPKRARRVDVDTTDRQAVRQHIQARLRRRR